MNTRLHTTLALTAIGLSLVLCGRAKACGIADTPMPGGAGALLPSNSLGAAMATVPGDSLLQSLPGMTNPLQEQEPITGLYRFTVTAKGDQGIPDGTVLDHGFTTWHADGTELMNSGRAPMTQSFCMGVWMRTGPRTYRLNHWAMSWDPTGKTYIGPTNIRENVRLDRDESGFSGTFTLVQYAQDGRTRLGGATGIVEATRVTADGN